MSLVSPLDELGENFFHRGVLLALLVDNLLDDLVLLAHLIKVLAGGLRLNIGLEAVGGDFVVALALESLALIVESGLGPFELGVEEVDLALTQVHVVLLTLILLAVNII